MMNRRSFREACLKNGLELSSLQEEQLQNYFLFLTETNKVMNLTAITEEEEVYEKHFYDSLLAFFHLNLENKSLVDVGTGAGFPGLVLAICFPKLSVTLIEPLNKRCRFLFETVKKLGLKNVRIVNDRGENYVKEHRASFDYAVARAVARLNVLLEIVLPLVKENGCFVAMKGRQGNEELEEADRALKILRGEVVDSRKSFLSDGEERINIYIAPKEKTPLKYPRPYAQIKKMPL